MMRIVVTTTVLAVAGLAWSGGSPALTEHESPRATDLLRAQRLAERTRSRLRTPRPVRRGWAHGGEGWNAPPKAPDQERRVVINVGPSRGTANRRTPVD